MRPLFLLIILFGFFHSSAQTDSFNFDSPQNLESLEDISIWATEYYVHVTTSSGDIPYLTPEGDTLGYFSDTCDFCTACLEGTVFLEDSINGRVVLNYAARANESLVNCRKCALYNTSNLHVESWGSVRWKVSSGYGEGVQGYQLVPYRTIAVDPSVIPYGTILFIPDAVGSRILLPNGDSIEHDGYFFAGDTGGAIKGNHIDVFTGTDNSHPFAFVRSNSRHTYSAYIVIDSGVIRPIRNLHR